MSGITLTAAVRQNLLALQNTADLMSQTQNRLATGKKVNSALDNPGAYFTASGLDNRASDLSGLLDDMGQAVQTLKAADTGIKAITSWWKPRRRANQALP
jgi:flagellin-like hook-associated protein FlgL